MLSDGHVLHWWIEVLAILVFYFVYSAIRNIHGGSGHTPPHAFDHALAKVLGAARVPRRPLAVLAHVDELRLAALELPPHFIDANLANSRFGILYDFEESGRVLHRPAGARLPVI